MSYTLWRFLHWLANHLPRRLAWALFTVLGWATFYLARGVRANAVDNMRHVLGPQATDAEVKAHARAALVHQLQNYYLLLGPLVSDEEWQANHTVEGWGHFAEAREAGKGVIFVSGHFGNLEHIAELVRRDYDLPFTAPAEAIKPPELFAMMVAQREKHGGRGIPADTSAMELVRRLRRGEVVGLAADLDVTHAGVVVDFFGAPALLPQGPARLSLLTRAPVIFAATVRQGYRHYHTVFERMPPFAQTGDREADIRAATRLMAEYLERWIGQCPTQWTQFSPIWRWAEPPPREGAPRQT